MSVNDKLRDLISASGKSIYSFANVIKMDRTYLSKILTGKRNLTVDKLALIVNALELDSRQRDEVIDDYIAENFSRSKFEMYTEGLLNNFSEKSAKNTLITKIDNDITVFENYRRLADFVQFYLSNDNGSARLYTNFPTSELLLHAEKRENCDFRCVINPGEKKEPISVLELMKLCLFCCVCYDSKDVLDKSYFSPYVIIGDDCVIFANKKLDKGYCVRNRDVADMYAADFVRSLNRVRAGTQTSDNILDLKALHLQHEFYAKTDRTVISRLCTVLFMSHEDFDEVAREDLPDREYLIDSTYEHYKESFKNTESFMLIHTINGLDAFCENGIISEFPLSYCRPLSVQTRVNILKRIVRCVKENPSKYTLNFLKNTGIKCLDNRYDIESRVSKENDEETVVFIATSDNTQENVFSGNYTFCSTNTSTNKEFNDFFDLLSLSSYVMTREESIAVLEDRIVRLEYSLNKRQ